MAGSTEDRHINIFLNNKQIGFNAKDVNAELRQMNAEIKKLTFRSDEYNKKAAEIRKAKEALREHGMAIGQISTAWDKVKTIMLGVVGGNVITNLFSKFTSGIRSAFSGVIEMDDAFADVEKTTGMTRAQVQALSDQFENLNTRTSQMELIDMAIIGGQIGIAKEEMFGFVEATDKAAVALGDEFTGGVQEVTNSVGGLKLLFKDTRDLQAGEAIIKVGSAINDLGAAGKANGPFMTDYANRVAGLGPKLTPRIAETLGLGAALQELGETAENAASGTKTLITTGASNIADYAKHLNMGKQELKDLINSNPNEFLLKLANSFKGMTPVEVIEKLNQLNIKSKEAQGVMLKLAGNVDFVREKQALANKSFAEGTSLQEEFNKKNETAGAQIEKVGKAIQNWLSDKLSGLVNGLASAAKWLYENRVALGQVVAVLAKAATVYAAYRVAQHLSNAENKLSIKGIYDWIKAQTQALVSGKSFTNLLTKLRSIDPFSLLAAGAVALYYVISDLVNETSEYDRTLEKLNEIKQRNLEQQTEEIAELDILFGKLNNMQGATAERQKLIDEINSKYGITLENLKDEGEMAAQVANAYDKIATSIKKKIDLEIKTEQLKELRKQMLPLEENEKMLKKAADIQLSTAQKLLELNPFAPNVDAETRLKRQGEIALSNLAQYRDEYDKIMKEMTATDEGWFAHTASGGEDAPSPSGLTGDSDKKQKEFDYLIDESKRINEALLGMTRDRLHTAEQLELFAIADKYNKEMSAAEEAIKKLQEKAKQGDAQALSQIDEFQKLLSQLKMQRDLELHEKGMEQMKKSQEEANRLQLDGDKELADAKRRIAEATMSDFEKEISEKNKYYDELITLAKQHGLDTIQLEMARIAAIKALQDGQKADDHKNWEETLKNISEKVSTYYQMVSGLIEQFNDLRNQKEENALDKLADYRDSDLENLKDAKEKGMITEEEYQGRKEGLENQYRHREKEIKTEQFIRERRAKVIESIINTFLGVTRALPNPFLMSLAAITGGIQTALIQAQPVPEFGRGVRFNGPSHAQGGMPIMDPGTGRTVATVEGGETLLSDATTRNNWGIVSRLLDSSMNGGGRRISMKEFIGTQPGYNFSGAQQSLQLSKGAFITPISTQSGPTASSLASNRNDAIMNQFVAEMRGIREDLATWKGNLKTEFVLRDHEKFMEDLDTARNLSSIRSKRIT